MMPVLNKARTGGMPVLYAFPKHDILKEFFEKNSTEVMKMLMTEWNMETALAVRYEEGHEDGWEGGLEKGIEKGREEGRKANNEEVARNALMKGFSIDQIHDITGLNADTIRNLGTSSN
jgi:predicted transposase/invertase (TIGR01784 family)